MWVVVISLAALLIPLSRILPPLYQWRIRKRIYRWYAQLRDVEIEALGVAAKGVDSKGVNSNGVDSKGVDSKLGAASTAEKASSLIARLDEIDSHVNDITVPLSHADEVYFLRQHIEMVRNKLLNSSVRSSI